MRRNDVSGEKPLADAVHPLRPMIIRYSSRRVVSRHRHLARSETYRVEKLHHHLEVEELAITDEHKDARDPCSMQRPVSQP